MSLSSFSKALLLVGLLAAPALAEEDCVALGDRWYRCFYEPITITPQTSAQVLLPLYEIPGGVQGAPVVAAKGPNKVDLRLSVVGFYPVGPTPYITVVVENAGAEAQTYRLKVLVQGGE